MDVQVAGNGVTGDLLAHCIDTAMWLNGSIDSVAGKSTEKLRQSLGIFTIFIDCNTSTIMTKADFVIGARYTLPMGITRT